MRRFKPDGTVALAVRVLEATRLAFFLVAMRPPSVVTTRYKAANSKKQPSKRRVGLLNHLGNAAKADRLNGRTPPQSIARSPWAWTRCLVWKFKTIEGAPCDLGHPVRRSLTFQKALHDAIIGESAHRVFNIAISRYPRGTWWPRATKRTHRPIEHFRALPGDF